MVFTYTIGDILTGIVASLMLLGILIIFISIKIKNWKLRRKIKKFHEAIAPNEIVKESISKLSNVQKTLDVNYKWFSHPEIWDTIYYRQYCNNDVSVQAGALPTIEGFKAWYRSVYEEEFVSSNAQT